MHANSYPHAPCEVPESPWCAVHGRLASQSFPSHRFDAGGFANSSSHQMWSVCSLQVSLFLHLSCRRCFLLFSSSLLAVSIKYRMGFLFPIALFLLDLGFCLVLVERRALSQAAHLLHTILGRLRNARAPCRAHFLSRSHYFFFANCIFHRRRSVAHISLMNMP
ncbi:hypothetical protein K449DRAFT_271289 [Hypoxylon sp. EC38]|nr:hypothetical protein K449DRAFT_271289 [Hypoxylon sp. EC38]